MALSAQQLGAAMGLGLPWAQVNVPPTTGTVIGSPGLVTAGGAFPVIVIVVSPPAVVIPQVTIPFTQQSRVGVVNLALQYKLGADRIDSFDEDSRAAVLANSNFDRILDQELSRYRWTFAIERRKVAAVSNDAWGVWRHSYALPADCLTLLWVGPYEPNQLTSLEPDGDWGIEGAFIRTNYAAPLPLTYIKRVLEPGLWHPLFLEALACRIGMEFAIPLTSSLQLWQKCEVEYKAAIREARRASAIQNPPRSRSEDPWLAARH